MTPLSSEPFDFVPINTKNRTRNIFTLKHWRKLKDLCIDHHLIPPTFGAKSSHIPLKETQMKHTEGNIHDSILHYLDSPQSQKIKEKFKSSQHPLYTFTVFNQER